ncbi:MAG TPA: glutathione S-transferase family protein [Mesorhizobium sp.]|jgi:glutathione S-transferase|nr:glutathione S-transferase family protein [Mesorhizobium sp.]
MRRLLYAPASPYSAKVRMAAAHLGVPLQVEVVDTNAAGGPLSQANPLGKIPVLIEEDGRAIFDSRVILRHLDRLGEGRLFAARPDGGLAAQQLEALADGVADCLLAHVYERRFRPEEKIHQPWLDRQWAKSMRGLDALSADAPMLNGELDGGQIALRALIGYLALRFSGQWEAGREALLSWAADFDRRHPALRELLPS